MDRQVRAGAHFCATTRQTLPRWIYSLSRPLASTCYMPSSLFGWTGESWSGSTLLEVLCADHVGTYVIPFLCRSSSGAWHHMHTSQPNEATGVVWRVRIRGL